MTTAIAGWPGTPKLFLNANNVDGLGNEFVENGSNVSGWVDQTGTLPLFDSIGTGGTPARQFPMMKRSGADDFVSFDGSFSILTSVDSKALLNGFHTLGVFDLIFVFRRLGGGQGQSRKLFGSAEGQSGITVAFDANVNPDDGVEGNVSVTLAGSNGMICNFASTLPTVPGRLTKLLIRGDGARLRVSTDFYNFQSKTFTGALGVGAATYDYSIGSVNPIPAAPTPYEGDVGLVAAWLPATAPLLLTSAQLLQCKDQIESQFGVGV